MRIFSSKYCFEGDVEVDDEIIANVNLVIDTTNTDDIVASLATFEAEVDDTWTVDAQTIFITSSPTSTPSTSPIKAPTTLIPTAQPSITGLVVTIEVNFY